VQDILSRGKKAREKNGNTKRRGGKGPHGIMGVGHPVAGEKNRWYGGAGEYSIREREGRGGSGGIMELLYKGGVERKGLAKEEKIIAFPE